MPRHAQIDLRAYWSLLQRAHEPRRMMLTAPATLSDVAAIYGLSRGIPLDPSSAAGKRGKHVNVKVYGGQLTEGIQRAADQFHVKNMKADWARSTGSSPAAIRWLTEQS